MTVDANRTSTVTHADACHIVITLLTHRSPFLVSTFREMSSFAVNKRECIKRAEQRDVRDRGFSYVANINIPTRQCPTLASTPPADYATTFLNRPKDLQLLNFRDRTRAIREGRIKPKPTQPTVNTRAAPTTEEEDVTEPPVDTSTTDAPTDRLATILAAQEDKAKVYPTTLSNARVIRTQYELSSMVTNIIPTINNITATVSRHDSIINGPISTVKTYLAHPDATDSDGVVDIEKEFVVGKPAYLSGKVYMYDGHEWTEGGSTSQCIVGITSSGTAKTYCGIIVDVNAEANTVAIANEGSFMMTVTDSSSMHVGDVINHDGTVVGDNVTINGANINGVVGKIASIVDTNTIVVMA